MADAGSSSSFPTTYNNLTDNQLRQTFSQIHAAASYASPMPQQATSNSKTYMKNLHTWSTTSTPPPKNQISTSRSSRARPNRPANFTNSTPQPAATPVPVQVAPVLSYAASSTNLNYPTLSATSRGPLPTTPQALQSSYASRLRTGATLLMQPILTSTSVAAGAGGVATNMTLTRNASRRGGIVNYTEPGSGDDEDEDEVPDAGAIDSGDDSDFIASGGTRTAVRQSRSRMGQGMGIFNTGTSSLATSGAVQLPGKDKAELDQSYLGQVPPDRFIKARPMPPTVHEYPSQAELEASAARVALPVPIRVEFETETHRVRDCFVWNLHETLITPESFARAFCQDLELPSTPWVDTVATQIRAQLEDADGVASMALGGDAAMDLDSLGEEVPECRVIISIDVQIANHHLLDHFEWDLLSPLTPEAFARTLCADLGLTGEALPLITHAIHEELIKHKKDAVEWGVIGPPDDDASGLNNSEGAGASNQTNANVMKDKTGLGLGWGRAPRDGRGPKTLRSVWRDWADAEEFRTTFEVLTAEEIERREIERERASRRLRRETSKFQSSTRSRRR